MAKVRVVPSEDMAILKKYLRKGEPSVVLIEASVLDELLDEEGIACYELDYLRKNGESRIDYAHGSEPDIVVDLVDTTDHYFLSCLLDDDEG